MSRRKELAFYTLVFVTALFLIIELPHWQKGKLVNDAQYAQARGAVERMTRWAKDNPSCDTQGIQPDEWWELALAAMGSTEMNPVNVMLECIGNTKSGVDAIKEYRYIMEREGGYRPSLLEAKQMYDEVK